MRPLPKEALLAAAAVLVGAGCSGPPDALEEPPARWVLVERSVSELASDHRFQEGWIHSAARVLVLEPLSAQDLAWEVEVLPQDYSVQVLALEPGPQATPGEVVRATVRVGRARGNELYRLVARASTPEIEILGGCQAVVRGENTAVFRFTRRSPGSGGIEIAVQKVGPERPGRMP